MSLCKCVLGAQNIFQGLYKRNGPIPIDADPAGGIFMTKWHFGLFRAHTTN